MNEALLNRRWVKDIVGAPTVSVLYDYIQAEHIHLNQFESDRFIWHWTASGEYSASSAYRLFFIGMTTLRDAKEIWRAVVPPKVLVGDPWETMDCRAQEASWPSG